MFCTNCGTRNPDAARFCGSCGTAVKVTGAASLAPPAATAQAQPSRPAVARVADQPAPGAFIPPPPGPAPQYAPPYAPQAVAPGAAAYPVPPNMHWLIVLILSAFTYGLGGLVWGFKQAFFVKKLDPGSKGVLYLSLAAVAMVVQVALYFIIFSSSSADFAALWMVSLTNVVIIVFALIGIFGMRKSLLRHYNTVEPIGLRLGGVMTFFFSILYFQYHFSRIANGKKAGTLK